MHTTLQFVIALLFITPVTVTHSLAAQLSPGTNQVQLTREQLEARVAANPNDLEAHVMLAKGHLDAGNPHAALPHLRIASELRPDASPLLFQYGVVRLETGDVEGAYATLSALSRREPAEAATRAYLARACALLQKPQEAREHLAVLRLAAPQQSMLHAQLVEWIATARVPEVALEQIAFTLPLALSNTQKARVLFLRSVAHSQLKQHDPAIASLEQAISLDDSKPEYYSVLLTLQGSNGMKHMDVTMLRQAVHRFPVSADLLLLTGLYNLEMEEYNSVREVAMRLNRVAPGSAHAQLLLGHLRMVAFEYAEAVKHFQDALGNGMDTPHLQYQLAKAFEKNGDYPQAIQHYQASHAMDAGRPDMLFDFAQLRLNLGTPDEAASLATTLLSLEPANPRVHKLLGDIARSQGKAADARKHLEEFKRLSVQQQATRKAPAP